MNKIVCNVNKVLVTGGTGVVGSALIRYLLDKKISVTAIVRPNSVRKKYLPPLTEQFQIIEGELGEDKNIKKSLSEKCYDAFFHFAWEGSLGDKVANRNDFAMQMHNIGIAYEAVKLCKDVGCKTFIMTGSQAEFGLRSDIINEDCCRNPNTAYGVAKSCAREITNLFCKINGIRHIWPILFSVYGLYDETDSMIGTTIDAIRNHKTIAYTSATQLWDYIYAADVARALVLLAEKGKSGESYIVAQGCSRPLAEYILDIYSVAKAETQPDIGKLPNDCSRPVSLCADITKLRNEIGFEPSYCFKDGIAEILNNC